MTAIPEKTYLKRADVIKAVGGRRELEKHERAGQLHRVHLTGYTRAHYFRAEVVAIQAKMQPVT